MKELSEKNKEDVDIPLRYEYLSRKNWKYNSDSEWIMFKLRCKVIKYGIETSWDTRDQKPHLWKTSVMKKEVKKRFKDIDDEEFFKLYKEYKSKLKSK